MIEDESFNAFLKGRLEEDVVVPPVAAVTELSTRRVWKPFPHEFSWLRPVFLAASVAVVCGLFSWQLRSGHMARLERQTVQAIEFLAECDSDERDVSDELDFGSLVCEASDTLDEKLLAWQDTPYAEIAE